MAVPAAEELVAEEVGKVVALGTEAVLAAVGSEVGGHKTPTRWAASVVAMARAAECWEVVQAQVTAEAKCAHYGRGNVAQSCHHTRAPRPDRGTS